MFNFPKFSLKFTINISMNSLIWWNRAQQALTRICTVFLWGGGGGKILTYFWLQRIEILSLLVTMKCVIFPFFVINFVLNAVCAVNIASALHRIYCNIQFIWMKLVAILHHCEDQIGTTKNTYSGEDFSAILTSFS